MSCEITLVLPGARLVIGRPEIWQIGVYYGILLFGLSLFRHVVSVNEREMADGSHPTRYALSDGVRTPTGRALRDALKHISPDGIPPAPQEECIIRNLNGYRRIKCVAVAMWVAAIIMLMLRFGEAGKLTMVVLDVGQGDGIFMKGPEGNTYLVDGGSSDVKKVGQYRLEPFLKSQGVGRLDYVLISHGDSDHMNGIEELIERQDIGVEIGTLVLSVKEAWDEALEELAGKARNHGIRVVVIEPGQSIREGGMVITCIQPGNMGIKSEGAESRQENAVPETGSTGLESGNAASMVLAVQYGEFDMLLTGTSCLKDFPTRFSSFCCALLLRKNCNRNFAMRFAGSTTPARF